MHRAGGVYLPLAASSVGCSMSYAATVPGPADPYIGAFVHSRVRACGRRASVHFD